VQSIIIIVLQQLRVNTLVSWVIEWSKSWLPHRCSLRSFTQWAWAIYDLSNHHLFWIIPDLGSQQRVTLLLESICTIPFQARASDVKMPKLRQHSSNSGMPCFVNVSRTIRGTRDQSDENPAMLVRCPVDIFSSITNRRIPCPGILFVRKIGQVSLVGYTYDWYNRRSSRKLILCIPLLVTCVHSAVDSMTLRVGEAHWSKIEVCLKWEMCYEELNRIENITVV